MPRGRQTPVEIRREVHRLVREEGITNAAEICRYLERKFEGTNVPVPSERSIRNLVRELVPPDPSGPWVPGEGDPEEDALVLETAAEWVRRTRKRRWPKLTQERARWIAWVRRGWPDLDPVIAFVVAEDYRARRANEMDTTDLDAFLAFTPWRGEQFYRQWAEAIEQERIPQPPVWYLFASALPVGEPGAPKPPAGGIKHGQAPQGQS